MQTLFQPSDIRLVIQVGYDYSDGTPGIVVKVCRQRTEGFSIARRDEDEIMAMAY